MLTAGHPRHDSIPELLLPLARSEQFHNVRWCYGAEEPLPIRLAFFWMSSNFVDIIGGFSAVGLLQMRGVGGYPGWAWLFMIEGAFTREAAPSAQADKLTSRPHRSCLVRSHAPSAEQDQDLVEAQGLLHRQAGQDYRQWR